MASAKVVSVFMFFLGATHPLYIFLVFFWFSLVEEKNPSNTKRLAISFVATCRILYKTAIPLWPKLPFLLCHSVGKLLASKFSLSRTSALLVLLPLGSFQHGHVIPQSEAPVYFLMHFSAGQHSHSQREHHCMYSNLRIWNVKKAPELAVLSIIGPPKQQLIQQWEVHCWVFSSQHHLIWQIFRYK